MMTRRRFTQQLGYLAAAGPLLGETVRASPARVDAAPPSDIVWLDANENPAGPPAAALDAIVRGAAATARYHFDEFAAFTQAIATSEALAPEQVIFGVGSGEIIDAAICAYTSSVRPLLTAVPTYDIPVARARSLGRPVIEIPLTEHWAFPVRQLVEQAGRAGGGLIYLCNPNNPTASMTPRDDVHWLAMNLPRDAVLLVDEAYLEYTDPTRAESAIRYVREGRSVVITRTFSKIYGMAGLRAGFGCARADLIAAIGPFRSNVIPVLGLRAAMAGLREKATLIPSRRETVARIRGEMCRWLSKQGIGYIEPHANFVMIDVGRDARAFGAEMFRRGVAVGRPFPPLDRMLRVTLGTDEEMARFREVFGEVYG